MKKHKAENKNTERSGGQGSEAPVSLGFKGILGISLLAGALYNIPAIWKIPQTNADWMMLVIVLAMALGGAILLFFRFRK